MLVVLVVLALICMATLASTARAERRPATTVGRHRPRPPASDRRDPRWAPAVRSALAELLGLLHTTRRPWLAGLLAARVAERVPELDPGEVAELVRDYLAVRRGGEARWYWRGALGTLPAETRARMLADLVTAPRGGVTLEELRDRVAWLGAAGDDCGAWVVPMLHHLAGTGRVAHHAGRWHPASVAPRAGAAH